MFSEYDVVRLVKDIPSLDLGVGARGVILFVYACSPAEYEVEFVNDEGETVAVATIAEADLRMGE